jgi:hypothetical protein
MISKALSCLLLIAYVCGALTVAGVQTALEVMFVCIVPLACVWFPDVLAELPSSAYDGAR